MRLVQLPQFEVHRAIEEKHWWFLGRRVILKQLINRLIPPSKQSLIVDVGCGTGGNAVAFDDEYQCVGIDPIPEAIEFAKERFPSVQFHCGYAPDDITDLMGRADVVLLMDVLEHVEDDFELVSKLLASMKPGAHLILMAPADLSLWGPHDRGFEHYRRCDLNRIRKTWEGLPVTEKICTYCNARLYWPIRFVRFLTRLRKKSIGPSDTDLSLPPKIVNALLLLLFSSEWRKIIGMLKGKKGFRHGVSVFAVLKREEGELIPRKRPSDLPPDPTPWLKLKD